MFKFLLCLSILFSSHVWASTSQAQQVLTPRGSAVQVLITAPDNAATAMPVLVIAPGQGYTMDGPILQDLAQQLAAKGILVYRFNWSYMSAQPKGEPSADLSLEAEDMLSVVKLAKSDVRADLSQILLGGKSLGSIVSYKVFQADPSVKALVLLTPVCTNSYNDEDALLPAPISAMDDNYPGLAAWNKPVLLVSGTKDPLCSQPMLYDYLKGTRGNFALVEVPGNHSWNVSDDASSSLNSDNVSAATAITSQWVEQIIQTNSIFPKNDQDWNAIATELQSKTSVDELDAVFREKLPTILADIQYEAKNTAYHALWGQSINFDELAKGTIVAPSILDYLLGEFQAPPRQDRYSHAGLEHTFGYLFSTLQTAFGFKRARWIGTDIEVGFGLPVGMMSPFPSEGTLFSNVTYLAAHIAFRDKPELIAIAENNSYAVSAEVKALAKSKFTIRRLEESVEQPLAAKIHTDIVTFPNAPATQSNQFWLVYSIDNHLITAFPVGKSFVDGVFDLSLQGSGVVIQTKYNAYIPGITDSPTPLKGTRVEL